MAWHSIVTILFSELIPILFFALFVLNLEKLEQFICDLIDLQICKENLKKLKYFISITIIYFLVLMFYYG